MYISRWWKITHACNEKQILGFFLILPNQTDRARHPCTSTGGGISHMPAMKSKIRGFFSFLPNQTKARVSITHIHQQVVEYHTQACNEKSKIRGFSSLTKPNQT
jgi:hypothetical protein